MQAREEKLMAREERYEKPFYVIQTSPEVCSISRTLKGDDSTLSRWLPYPLPPNTGVVRKEELMVFTIAVKMATAALAGMQD